MGHRSSESLDVCVGTHSGSVYRDGFTRIREADDAGSACGGFAWNRVRPDGRRLRTVQPDRERRADARSGAEYRTLPPVRGSFCASRICSRTRIIQIGMAALPEAPFFETIELPQLAVSDLDPLLNEEIEVWEKRFCWDFRSSATLLRRFLQMRSLYGYALRVNRQVVGYAYYVCEARKGLVGDFYVRRDYNSPAAEFHLLGAVIQGLVHTPGIRRIESQLILLQNPLQPPPFGNYLTRHDRFFML